MSREIRRRDWLIRWHELPLLAGLAITWMALWQEISLMSLLSGLVVSLFAMRVFYLPPVVLAGRFNLWWGFRYVAYFLWHLSVASFQVAWLALRPGPPPAAAIVDRKSVV